MSKHILKLHVERPGTAYSSPNGTVTNSPAGHVWYEVVYPKGESKKAGFAPQDPKSGTRSVPGKVFVDDGQNYAGEPAFTAQYEITEAQARTLEQFSKDPKQFGFDKDNYHAFTNSCVDFLYKGLELIGMNPEKKQGDVMPMDNIDDFQNLKNPAIPGELLMPANETVDPWNTILGRVPASNIASNIDWGLGLELPERTGTIIASPLGPAKPVIPAPTWSGFEYGDCLVWDDPTPGIDKSDHSICQRFYAQGAVTGASPFN